MNNPGLACASALDAASTAKTFVIVYFGMRHHLLSVPGFSGTNSPVAPTFVSSPPAAAANRLDTPVRHTGVWWRNPMLRSESSPRVNMGEFERRRLPNGRGDYLNSVSLAQRAQHATLGELHRAAPSPP